MAPIPEPTEQGPSPACLVRVALVSLLVAGTLTWAWRKEIFAHTSWTPARTEVLEIDFPAPSSLESVDLPPKLLPPAGGVLVRIPRGMGREGTPSLESQTP